MVRAAAGKRVGTYIARVAIRATGFRMETALSVVQGVSHKHCRLLQRGDGYGYQTAEIYERNCETRGKSKRARARHAIPHRPKRPVYLA